MNKKLFITTIIGTHIIFVMLHIHTYSRIIKQSYQKQKNEQLRLTLTHKKQQLTQQLYLLKEQVAIKQFALEQLHLEPINLKQVRKLKKHD